jgi:selenocysteine-specific elongation factor
MKVIGTAGHVDHGKSTLVERLTGIDPDRLEEEKRRGMTIDLGFAWLTLPSGIDVSIVDVPGHERFVRNMVAGAAGIDVALLVVAADEGVMPQTREHLAILDLLAVRHGVVALTKADLVDREWIELATAEVADLLADTSLAGSSIVPVSSSTGAGIPELLEALDAEVAHTPDPASVNFPYLPIDRAFHVAGFGTVVTGTLHGGQLETGVELEVTPGGKRGRARSIQTHRQRVERAGPGSRVAVNFAGQSLDQLSRGDVLSPPGALRTVTRLVASTRVLEDAPFPLRHGIQISAHLGAAERAAYLRVLGATELAPGAGGWIELRFGEPVAAIRGQRYILRLPSPARTVAGGEVVDIAPRRQRIQDGTFQYLEDLGSAHLRTAVLAALRRPTPEGLPDLASLLGRTQADVGDELAGLVASGEALQIDGAFLSLSAWQSLEILSANVLRRYHHDYPLRRGMGREELRAKVGWNRAHWSRALVLLAERKVVVLEQTVVRLPDHVGGTASRREEADRVVHALTERPFAPPAIGEVLAQVGADMSVVAALLDEGRLVRVGEDLYFAEADFARMETWIIDHIQREGNLTVAQMRDSLGTSRKYALAVLEYLDAQRITRRVGDTRVLGSKAPHCA